MWEREGELEQHSVRTDSMVIVAFEDGGAMSQGRWVAWRR